VGDFEFSGWLSPLNKAIYPARQAWAQPERAEGCPRFGSHTVLDDDSRHDSACIQPGLHTPQAGRHSVVWWDPGVLRLNAESHQGLANHRILAGTSNASHEAYAEWQASRQRLIREGAVASIEVVNPTAMPDHPADMPVELVHTAPVRNRPYGPRFGVLVHALLNAAVGGANLDHTVASLARSLGCEPGEVDAGLAAVHAAVEHPLLKRARLSSRCYRELPVSLRLDGAHVMEGNIDLAFEEDGGWCVVDYKTDAPDGALLAKYERQVGWYGEALRRITGKPIRCYLLAV
jgi:ATP-dependent exoDNAse (exonuclease V) beta subunit